MSLTAVPSPAWAAPQLTDNVPVGLCVVQLGPGSGARFTLLSNRCLQILDLEREAVMADIQRPLQAVHPDDRPGLVALATKALTSKKTLLWEGRLHVHRQIRWVTVEAAPHPHPDGGTVWETAIIDITDRKKAEQQVLSSEDEMRRQFDNLPIAVATTTLGDEPKVLFLNAHCVRLFGYTIKDIPTVAEWARRAYPDESYRHETFRIWNSAVARAVATKGSVESMEFTVTCRDGTRRDTLIGAAVMGENLLIALVDITERNRAERELRNLRSALERTAYELTENIPVGTYTMVQPPDGGMASFSFMSKRFLELTGLKREEALQNPLRGFACVHPDDYDRWVQLNVEVFEKKLPFFGETRIIVDGRVRWITAESVPRTRPDGSTVWEGVLTDITSRKLAEQQLAANEARLRKILENLPVPLAINGPKPDSEILFLNEAFVRTFGYTREDIPTVAHWGTCAYPDENYRQASFKVWTDALERARKSEKTVQPLEFRVFCKDGTERIVEINAVIIGEMILVSLLDLTARKHAEQELTAARRRETALHRKQRRQLEQKLKTSLTASAVAHEINQPLSTILLESKLALRHGDTAEKTLRSVAAQAQRVVSTIEKMKVLLRNVETGHKSINLTQVIKSSILQVKVPLAHHRVRVHTSQLSKTCRLMGDDAQLQLALTNLLRNAAEAIAESDTQRREISIDVTEREKSIDVIIGDSGPGWSGAEKDETPLHTTKPDGSGIGLFVVRTAVKNHRGKIIFGRSPLGGAEVRLRFPRLDRPPAAPTPAPTPAPAPAAAAGTEA